MDIRHNGQNFSINGNLLLLIEQELRAEAVHGWQRNWHLRVANRVFPQRAQYPYNDANPTRADIGAAVSWMALSVRSAQALQASHENETPFNHVVPLHPHAGPGYTIYGEVMVEFSDGRPPRLMPFQMRRNYLPSAAEVAAEAAMQAERWTTGTLGGNFASVRDIELTRMYRGD